MPRANRINEQLAARLNQAAESLICTSSRDDVWTTAVGVGDATFLSKLKEDLGLRAVHRNIRQDGQQLILRDQKSSYSAETCPKFAD